MTNDECPMTKESRTTSRWCKLCSFVLHNCFVIRHSSFGFRHSSIHIPLVALLAFQLLDVFVRLFDTLAAVLLDNLAQGCIHVLGHAARVTAHEKLRALGVDPFPNLGCVF